MRHIFFVKGVFDYQIENANKSLFIEVVGCPGGGKEYSDRLYGRKEVN
jgi:hypothetical protein